MSVVKSFSVCSKKGQPGDMFYINHGTDNFSVIDCCLNDERKDEIIEEIKNIRSKKGIFRFISTHPDDDHICGLIDFTNKINIENFYCVNNCAMNPDGEVDFKLYCKLRDSSHYSNYSAYHIYQGCSRKWMNDSNEERKSSGINILWPKIDNADFKSVLESVKDWKEVNNLSPIIRYACDTASSFIWFGDLENSFMEKIKDTIKLPETKVVFAPHHGRISGKLISEWLKQLQPTLIIIGEAESENLCYYCNYDTITQNTAGDITFRCENNEINIYVSNKDYDPHFKNIVFDTSKLKYLADFGYYKGTIVCDS